MIGYRLSRFSQRGTAVEYRGVPDGANVWTHLSISEVSHREPGMEFLAWSVTLHHQLAERGGATPAGSALRATPPGTTRPGGPAETILYDMCPNSSPDGDPANTSQKHYSLNRF